MGSSATTPGSPHPSRDAWPGSPSFCRSVSATGRPGPGALAALAVGTLLGIAIAVAESRGMTWVPSATGVGIGMMVPAAVIFVMFLGGVVEVVWRRLSPETYDVFLPPVASGFIAGEALVAVTIPLLVVLGILHV